MTRNNAEFYQSSEGFVNKIGADGLDKNNASRDFKGIWIPRDIWLNEELSCIEKCLLAEIDSLDNANGCFASNLYFSKFFGISEINVSKHISKLKKFGYIKQVFFNGRRRILKSCLNKFDNSALSKSIMLPYQNRQGSPIEIDKHINIVNNKKNKKDILSKSAKADLPESDSLIEIPKKNISILDDKEILISDDNVILEINGKEETYNLQDSNSLELELNKNIKLLSSGKESTVSILARIYLLAYLIKYKTNFRKKLYPRDYKNLKTILLDYGPDTAFKLLLYSITNWDRIKNNLNIKNQIPTIDNIIKYRQQLDIFRNQETQKKNKKQGEW